MSPETKAKADNESGITITPAQLALAFAGLLLLNVLLRVFYLRYDFVNGDEGVRALTAVRMIEGARLYADVVTDKPPGASLYYLAVFSIFGRSMKAVHAVTIVWSFATSLIVYLIGARLNGRRMGLAAALFFVYFGTNYFTQDVMAANTEILMSLPYVASFYFFIRSGPLADVHGNSSTANTNRFSLIAAGALVGVAALFKQIGVLGLLFFSLQEAVELWRAEDKRVAARAAVVRLWWIASGFAAVLAAFVAWLVSIGALQDFWRNGIVLNMFYIDSEPADLWMKFMIGRGLGYVFFNAVLWSLAGWAVWRAMRFAARDREGLAGDAVKLAHSDQAIALWGAVSLVGVIISGRFFGHYFIPALPALSLLAARGFELLKNKLNEKPRRPGAQLAAALLGILFLFGLFRCHHRTAVLAYETVTGTRTRWSADWGMTKREQEAEVVAGFVRSRIPAGEPLYIWGYAHDVFWRTGCRPASRYLTPYFIDGRFPDAESTTPSSGEQFKSEAAAMLLEDLRSTRPRLILDVQGSFKSLPYPNLAEFVDENYRDGEVIGPDPAHPFRVLELKTETEKQDEAEGRARRKNSKRERSKP